MSSYKSRFGSAESFVNRGPKEGATVDLNYESVTTETTQEVTGTVLDGPYISEFTRVETDDGEEYEVCGFGLEDREVGEVLKDGRRIGHYEHVLVPREPGGSDA